MGSDVVYTNKELSATVFIKPASIDRMRNSYQDAKLEFLPEEPISSYSFIFADPNVSPISPPQPPCRIGTSDSPLNYASSDGPNDVFPEDGFPSSPKFQKRKRPRRSTESTASTIGSASILDGQFPYDADDFSNDSFVEPCNTLRRRSSRLLKRITSSTSFDLRTLTRKRKRRDVDEDAVSVQSFGAVGGLESKATSVEKKSKRSMRKMSSLVNMFSPSNNRMGRALERSFSFKQPNSPAAVSQPAAARQITPYKKPKPASCDRKASRFWCETVDEQIRSSFSSQEIKRQEAIFELVQGEEDMIKDLKMVHELYHNSMKVFHLMTDEELDSIFGIVQRLVPLHEDLLHQLRCLRRADGTTDEVSSALQDWVHNLRQYEKYCANQVFAKGLLDYKKNDPKVEDFLNRCQESSFSRKLDLWNFLDLPRSRLVKYPLLLKQIRKQTSDDHPDKALLHTVIEQVEEIIKDVDEKMGESKCRQAVESLEFPYESQKSVLIDQSTSLVCAGQLKNDRGTKVHVFLFSRVLVVTRQATRNNVLKYQVVKNPIPLSDLELGDLSELEGRRGSFKKKVLRQPSIDKCAFRIGSRTNPNCHFHTLRTKEEHDKRQWLSCIQKAMLTENNTSYQEQMTVSSVNPLPKATECLSSSNSTDSSSPECGKWTERSKADRGYETVV